MKIAKYIIVAVLLIGGSVFFLLSYHQDKQRRMREEAAALETARRESARYHEVIRSVAESVFEAETQAREQIASATNAVRVVTGTAFTRRPDRRYLPTRTVQRTTPAPTPAAEEKSESAAKGAPEDEMPPGMLSREQLDRMRAAQMARQGEKAQPEKVPPAKPSAAAPLPLPGKEDPSPTEPDPPPAAEVPKEPEIAVQARKVVFQVESIMENAGQLRTMRRSAETLAGQVAAARESRVAAGQAAEIKALHDAALILKDEVESSMQALDEPLQTVLQAKADHIAEQQRRREAREKLLQDEAQREQTRKELAQVGALQASAREHVKGYRYSTAVEEIRSRSASLQTPAAKRAAAALLERYEHLQALHEFLIERINARRYRWGWGQGPSAKDVVAANERVLQVTGMTVPWEDVPLPQMVRLLRYYVEDQGLDRRQRARQQLALAIFYMENELDDLAASLASDMRRRYPTLHDDMDRLLP